MRTRSMVTMAAIIVAPALLLGTGRSAEGVSTVATWSASIVDEDPTRSSGEPSISVAEDGTLYIVAPAGLTNLRGLPAPLGSGGDYLWRSDDGGATWQFLPNTVAGGGDGDIVAGAGDVVFASGLSLACVTVGSSSDRGETWVSNPIGCADAPVDDRQWNDEHEGAVYTSFGSIVGVRTLYVNRSLVSVPGVVAGPTVRIMETDHQWPGVLDIDPLEGTVYQAWGTFGAPNDCDADDPDDCRAVDASKDVPDEIRIAALSASDFTTGPVTSPEQLLVATRPFDTFDAFVGVDVSPQGAVYVVWNERHPEVKETWSMLSVSTDRGATWTAPTRTNAIGTTAFPWVTAGDDGRVMVSYYGTSAKGNSPETVNGDWRVYNAFSDDGGATFTETIVTAAPMHAGAVCTSGTGCANGARDLIDFFETDVTPEGCLVVTYTDNSKDVVVDGERVTNNPERIAFAKQTGGPSLLVGKTCGAAAPAPSASGEPSSAPTTAPTAQPRPEPLPSTGGSERLPLLAALVAGTAVTAAVRRRSTSARRAATNTAR